MTHSVLRDERGAVYPYLMFFIIVVFCALVWIAFNEVILHVDRWAITRATAPHGGTWPILLTLYRMTPLVVILSAFVWAVVKSHRDVGWS
jgi:hypothetical protein